MVSGVLHLDDLQRGWQAWDRLDGNDDSHLRACTVFVHHPQRFAITRFDFDTGAGFEMWWTVALDDDDVADLIKWWFPSAQLIERRPFGYEPPGLPKYRLRAFIANRPAD